MSTLDKKVLIVTPILGDASVSTKKDELQDERNTVIDFKNIVTALVRQNEHGAKLKEDRDRAKTEHQLINAQLTDQRKKEVAKAKYDIAEIVYKAKCDADPIELSLICALWSDLLTEIFHGHELYHLGLYLQKHFAPTD